MSTKKLLRLFGFIGTLSVFLATYGLGAQIQFDNTPSPVVIQRTPERGEELSVDGTIELVFDRAMDHAAVEKAFSLLRYPEAETVSGWFDWPDERTARFQPARSLSRDTEYRVALTSEAAGVDGHTLIEAFTFRFRTVGYLEVSQVIPAPGTQDIEADGTITVMFNRPVVPLVAISDPKAAGLPHPLDIDPVISGTGQWLNTSIYVFTPTEPLAGGTTYTARVSSGLTDTTGGVLAEDFVWTFSTQPPNVVWVDPDQNEDLVPVDTSIRVTFNMPIDLNSARERFTLRTTSLLGELLATKVQGTYELDDNTLVFTPSNWLAFAQGYVVSLDAGVRSAAGGLGMEKGVSWRFTTVPLPKIVGTDPRNGERDAYPYTAFRIHFNAPIDPDTVMSNLEMEPALDPALVDTYFSRWDNTFVLRFGAQPSTEYVLHIGPGIADPYGNITGQSITVRFRTAPLDPTAWLHVPGRIGTYSTYQPARMIVAHLNTERLNLSLYRLAVKDYFAASNDWYDYAPPTTSRLRRWSVDVESPLNEVLYTPVELLASGGSLEPGIYLLDLEADKVRFDRWRHRHILIASPINLTLKTDEHQTLVWATDLSTGAPAPGLILRAYDDDGVEQAAVITDGSGLASFPGTDALGWYGATVIGSMPFTMGSSNWDSGISVWEFGFSSGALQEWRGHIDTDRPLYRAGQTVYFRGVIRAEDDARYRLPRRDTIEVTIRDAVWEEVYQQILPLDEFGAFSGELDLSESASLGSYQISAGLDGTSFSGSFQVAAYRAPEFEVTVTPDRAEIARGEANTATVDVQYFFGGPVAGVPVEWNVLSDPFTFQPDQFGRYTFTDDDDPWICRHCWWWQPTEAADVVLSGSGTTDAQGRLVIELPENVAALTVDPDAETPLGSRQLTVEATVQGGDGQVLSGRSTMIVHRGEFYVGLASRSAIGRAGDEMTVDVVTVDWAGKRLPDKSLEYAVYRREWENTYVEDETGGQWTWTKSDIAIAAGTLFTTDHAEGLVAFIPPEGGTYKVVVRGRDERERIVQSSLFAWVSGPKTVSWRRTNDDRITLISDKTGYVPGETAQILIPSPFPGEQWALVTVERGGILHHEVRLLESNSTVYPLPITADYVPNIYVSVVLMQGREAALAAAEGTPAVASHRVGYVGLTVEPVPQTLNISVTPSTEQALPGSEASFDIRVTDADGKPIITALSFDLVDKAVLTLKPRVPNAILEAFYGRRGLGVATSSGLTISIDRLFLEQIEEVEELPGAGTERYALEDTGAAPAPMAAEMAVEGKARAQTAAEQLPPGVELREQFEDTAYWAARIVTDEDGAARATVDLPDNLTTWVVRGVGVTEETQVGEATTQILVTKPLLIRPVTPRFFVVGDRVKLAANVNNNTNKSRTVEVTLGATGLALEDPAVQTITIPAGGEARATWWVTVEDVPQVDVAFSAVSGELSDAARPRLTTGPEGTLLVYRYTAPEIVGTGGQLVGEGSRTEIVALPPKYDDRRGELSVRLDPSLAAAMKEGLEYLEHFPYECTEQVVSRFLPNVLTYRALKKLGIEDSELAEKLPGLLAVGLEKLYLQQHADGGWGWWSSNRSSSYLTAYVAFALNKIKEAGFEVRKAVLDRALDFLGERLVSTRELDTVWEANLQAWLLYVLADAGRTAQASEWTGALFEARGKLSHYARAFFAMTLELIQPGDARIQTILSDLQNDAILSATGAHWEEEDYDWWAMNTDTRSTAVIIDALAVLDPDNALIPNAVRWLMIARQDGIWETTQETAWALIALTDWMVVTGELQGDYDYLVRLNNALLKSGSVTPQAGQDSIELRVDVADLLADAGNRLTVGRTEGPGRLYYTAHLKVYLPVEEIEPLNRGLIVQRQYVPADCPLDEACEQIDRVAVGDTVQVRLTIIAPHDLYYVVVEDPLPAGGEAIDTSLATTSLLDLEPGLFRETEEDGWSGFYWWWWRWYSRSEMRDEKVVLFADYLPAGTYSYQYSFRAAQAGEYHVIPTTAHEFYFPEVFGRADGRLFTITEE